MRGLTPRLVPGLVLGVIAGVVVPALVLGIGATHTACSLGPVIGSSGLLASPDDIALAPPGGFVNSSVYVLTVYNSSFRTAMGAYSLLPQNSSSSTFELLNWTLHSELSSSAFGWGSNSPCPAASWPPASGTAGGWTSSCSTCPIAAPAHAGVGQRLVVPPQFNAGGVPSAVINESYGPMPFASFAWGLTQGGIGWSSLPQPAAAKISVGPFYEHGQLFGLGVTLTSTGIQFGIPIHLLSGTEVVVPASFPADWPFGPPDGTNLTITMTYVFPATTGQGTWAVYLPGPGSPFSSGGLLFEQTAQGNSSG